MIDQCLLNVMKRYEYKIVAALLTIVISMCCPPCATGAPRNGHVKERRRAPFHSRYECSPISQTNSSYFVRSSCPNGGYLTVHRGKVVLQLGGLEDYNELAAFEKESCTLDSLDSSPVVRYRHKHSDRILCFRDGRIRAVKHNMARSPRSKCLFREGLLEASSYSSPYVNTFHTIQSVHKKGWFLGFSPKSLRVSSTIRLKGSRGRGALPAHGRTKLGPGCGFLFHSEEGRAEEQVEEDLINSILDYVEGGRVNTIVNEAAYRDNDEVDTRLVNNNINDNKQRLVNSAKVMNSRRNRKQGRRKNRRRNPVRHLNKKRPRLDRRTKNQRKKSEMRKKPKERMGRRRQLSK